MRPRWFLASPLALLSALGLIYICRDRYRVVAYKDADPSTATVRRLFGTAKLEIECYGSMIKGTDLSDRRYRTSRDRQATWEGVVGTDHWVFGCRPLPIGFTVKLHRQKYPANFLEYDTSQEGETDTYFSHSYWKVVWER